LSFGRNKKGLALLKQKKEGYLVSEKPAPAKNATTNYIGFRIPTDERKRIEQMAKE